MGLQEDTLAKINERKAELDEEAAKGPAQVQADKTAELYAVYKEAQNNMISAPDEYVAAKTAYLLSRDGEDGLKSYYDQEARALKTTEQEDFKKMVDEATASAETFKTVSNYAIKAQDMYLTQLNSYAGDLNEVTTLQSEKNTAERKSYYLHKVGDETATWDGILTVYIVALAFVYAYHVLYELGHFRSIPAWTGLVLILLSSYLLPRIVAFLIGIKPAMNIYTTWAQPSAIWTGSAIRYDPNAVKTGTVI
jgi:hypothetical protein